MRSISTATALAVLFGSAALSVVATGTASAATANITSPGGLVADGALKRVFVGDSSTGWVVGTDYSGNVVASVSGISGVSALTVSDDGTTVYAAAQGTHEIVALDATTLDVKARYPVATGQGPRNLAFSAGKVWFTYGDQSGGGLGSFDPATDPASGTDPVTLGLMPEGVSIYGIGLLDTAASRPGVLAVGETGISTDSMAVLDVSGATPQKIAYYHGDYTLNSGIWDIDLVPGADEVLVNGSVRDAYAGGTFTEAGTYPGGLPADIAPDGTVAVASGTSIATYKPNATKAIRTYALGTFDMAALTWAPDNSRIFALVGKSGGGYTLKALTDPEKNVPTLTVSAPPPPPAPRSSPSPASSRRRSRCPPE